LGDAFGITGEAVLFQTAALLCFALLGDLVIFAVKTGFEKHDILQKLA